jgi:hypothetical protein
MTIIEIKDENQGVKDGKLPRKAHPRLVASMTRWVREPIHGEHLRVLALYHAPRGIKGQRLRVWDLVEGPKRELRELTNEIFELAWGHAEGLKGEQPFQVDAYFGEGSGNVDICLFSAMARADDDENGLDFAGTERSERRQVQMGAAALVQVAKDLIVDLNVRRENDAKVQDGRLKDAYARIDKLESHFDTSMVKRVAAVDAIEQLKDRTSIRTTDEESRRSTIRMKEKFFQQIQLLLPVLVSKFRIGPKQPQHGALYYQPAPHQLPAAPVQQQPPVQPATAPVAGSAYAPPAAYGPSVLSMLGEEPQYPEYAPQVAPVAAPQQQQQQQQAPAAPPPPAAPMQPAEIKDFDGAMGHLRALIVNADETLVQQLLPSYMTLSMPHQATITHIIQKCRSPEGPGPAERIALEQFFESLDEKETDKFMGALPQSFKEALGLLAFFMMSDEERQKVQKDSEVATAAAAASAAPKNGSSS